MAQASNKEQGTPVRSNVGKLTEIERIAGTGAVAKELAAIKSRGVRPFGAEEVDEKAIDYLARPDLSED
jgi:hypothetical protein